MTETWPVRQRSLHRLRAIILALALLAALLFPIIAHADAGPKPRMDFTFEFEGEPIAIVEAQLIQCDEPTCAGGVALEHLGPQGIRCEGTVCKSIAYTYSDYHRLVVEFEDRTRESQVFTKSYFASRYRVTVSEDALLVEETGGTNAFCSMFAVTLLLELAVAALYLKGFGLPNSLLAWVPLASILTLPMVWFVFPLLPVTAGVSLGLSEMYAVGFELGLLWLVGRWWVPFRHVAGLTLAMNAASMVAGLLL